MLALVLAACRHSYPPPPKLPAPVVNQQVGPGDVLEIVVVGEDKLPKDYEVSPDGTIDYVQQISDTQIPSGAIAGTPLVYDLNYRRFQAFAGARYFF
jgi:polysaccharide export outer membrane protein